MKINIAHIPEEGLRRHFEETGEWFDRMMPADMHRDFSVGDMAVNCLVESLRNKKISVKGDIRTTLKLQCSRCVEAFDRPVELTFRYIFWPTPEYGDSEAELSKEDLECSFYSDDTIELDDIIVEQIVLMVPVKPVCKEECKGLCPVCGVNRNTADCGHKEKNMGSPFTALKNFKVKKGS